MPADLRAVEADWMNDRTKSTKWGAVTCWAMRGGGGGGYEGRGVGGMLGY